jgi:hypothetical protein
MVAPLFSPLNTFREFSAEEMKIRARTFRDEMVRRRTVRQFSNRPVAREVIDDLWLAKTLSACVFNNIAGSHSQAICGSTPLFEKSNHVLLSRYVSVRSGVVLRRLHASRV